MGNCFSNSRPEDDLRNNSFGPVKDTQPQKKNHVNVFKKTTAPEYTIESRVSLGQAAKENTQQILDNKQNQERQQTTKIATQYSVADQIDQGKFTFEPNQKHVIHQVAGNDIIDAGISFGGAHRLDNGSTNLSFVYNYSKNLKSFHQSRNDADDARTNNTIKEQTEENDDSSLL